MSLIAWLTQPSTLRGLSLVAGSSIMTLNPELIAQTVTFVTGLLGAIETFRNEHAKEPING